MNKQNGKKREKNGDLKLSDKVYEKGSTTVNIAVLFSAKRPPKKTFCFISNDLTIFYSLCFTLHPHTAYCCRISRTTTLSSNGNVRPRYQDQKLFPTFTTIRIRTRYHRIFTTKVTFAVINSALPVYTNPKKTNDFPLMFHRERMLCCKLIN